MVKGSTNCMLTKPEIPPSILLAKGLLKTSTELISSAGNCSKRTLRLGSPLTISRPFMVARFRRGPIPRIEIWLAFPRSRSAAIPGKRARASVIVTSGSCPRSSVEIISTVESANFLCCSERVNVLPKPRTVITSVSLISACLSTSAASCAEAMLIFKHCATASAVKPNLNCVFILLPPR